MRRGAPISTGRPPLAAAAAAAAASSKPLMASKEEAEMEPEREPEREPEIEPEIDRVRERGGVGVASGSEEEMAVEAAASMPGCQAAR